MKRSIPFYLSSINEPLFLFDSRMAISKEKAYKY